MKRRYLVIFLVFLLGLPLSVAYSLSAGMSSDGSTLVLTAQADSEATPPAPAMVVVEPESVPAAPEVKPDADLVPKESQPVAAPEAKPEPPPVPAEPVIVPAQEEEQPAPARVEAAPAERAGKEAHGNYAQMKIIECNGCHRGMGITPNHGADWSREHRIKAEKAGSNCADCHQQSFCLDCHVGGGIEPDLSKSISRRGEYTPKTHLADFISIHPIKAKDSPQKCYRCHEAAYCYDCHSRMQKNTLNVKSHTKTQTGQQYVWSAEHAREARRDLQSCQTCHPEGKVCMTCHSAVSGVMVNPHPKKWNGSKLQSKGGDRSCRICH